MLSHSASVSSYRRIVFSYVVFCQIIPHIGIVRYYLFQTRPRLLKLDNKVLAAYLYVKTKQLRKIGVNCEVNIYNYTTTSKIKTSKLLPCLIGLQCFNQLLKIAFSFAAAVHNLDFFRLLGISCYILYVNSNKCRL